MAAISCVYIKASDMCGLAGRIVPEMWAPHLLVAVWMRHMQDRERAERPCVWVWGRGVVHIKQESTGCNIDDIRCLGGDTG